MWFYLFMPFIAFLASTNLLRWCILITLCVLSIAYRSWLGDSSDFVFRYSLPGVADAFLVGMIVALISASNKLTKFAGLLFPAGAIWYLSVCLSLVAVGIDHSFQLAASSGLMIAGLACEGNWPWQRWMTDKVLVTIGHISFSMFLCNIFVVWYVVLPIGSILAIESTEGRLGLNFFVGFPIIFLLSFAGYKYIEQPFMRSSARPTRRDWVPMGYLGLAVIATVVSLSILAHTMRDGVGMAYERFSTQLVANFLPKTLRGANLKVLPFTGDAYVNSESKLTTIQLEKTSENSIKVSSVSINNKDGWIALMLPVDENSINRDSSVRLRLRLVSDSLNKVDVCLGIFDGLVDRCSSTVNVSGNRELEIQSRLEKLGPVQFKLNIFPSTQQENFSFSLIDIKLQQIK
jgi:hypothetical protein